MHACRVKIMGYRLTLQPFTINLEDLEAHVLAHFEKWRHKNGSTMFNAYFRKKTKQIFSANRQVW